MDNSKRNYRVELRLNEEEKKQLAFLSNELGISKSEVIADSSYELYYGHKRGKKYADKI